MVPAEQQSWADEADRLRRRTRLARRGYWFPMLAFGLLVLGCLPYFRPRSGSSTTMYSSFHPALSLVAGGNSGNPSRLAVYWLIGAPVAYFLSAAFYRFRARRVGVSTSTKVFVAVGLGLLLLLVVLSAVGMALPGRDTAQRGLLPLITFGVGFCVLAWAERSWALGVFSALFLGLTVTVNVFSTVTWVFTQHPTWLFEHHLGLYLEQIDPFVVGAVLMVGGLLAGALFLIRRRSLL
jgi:hypothetical protein